MSKGRFLTARFVLFIFAILATGYYREERHGLGLKDPWSLLDAGQDRANRRASGRGPIATLHKITKPPKLSAATIPIGFSLA
ncbi:hypothetical protein ACD578_27895 (plasmid) [Microvirga sp. RSM25]|uniref:hypothetical protein n=1 Tax=Microvirga sp. RSM25 TaxID=3273802 RepID=UPI00384A8210